MFFSANTSQNPQPPRGRTALPQTTASRAARPIRQPQRRRMLLRFSLVPGAFLSFEGYRPANK
jgi:hypothetical protein